MRRTLAEIAAEIVGTAPELSADQRMRLAAVLACRPTSEAHQARSRDTIPNGERGDTGPPTNRRTVA